MKSNLLLIEAVTTIMNAKYDTLFGCALFNRAAVVFGLLSVLTVSGCQTLSGYNKIENANEAELWAGQIIPLDNEVNIACAGTYHCEIIKIDNTAIISEDTHKPINPALLVPIANTFGLPYNQLNQAQKAQVQAQTILLTDNHSVKLIALSASGIPGLINYYASVKPIKREVHVNYYPENNMDYIERFALIDEFKEQGIYLLQAYRQKPTKNDGSLLDNASATPLCIDLLKDRVLQRRFCKQLDSANQGEFVEMSIKS
ncbi:MAG: hypothetical protein L0G25_01450 [Psychrobacter sp.]|nr:hypothetical protein [Psychrobacter sp.]